MAGHSPTTGSRHLQNKNQKQNFYSAIELEMSWETIARSSQKKLLDSIPQRWRLDIDKYRSIKDATNIPRTCGILSEKQLKITDLTAAEVVRRLETRELKAVEVLEAFAARTAIAHQLVNCLTDWFFEDGLKQAKELDRHLDASGRLVGVLHGVPIALKDYHSIKGRATTTGYVARRDHIPNHDSAIVGALRTEGAVFFCKTTMPQTGMALETVSNLWGRTLNPFNRDLSAGGSSGGDAALVAMRGCPIAPSTDSGGSIRVPAAFNGLYAIRPTADRIPKGGMDNTNTGQTVFQLSCGPVCHSMEDLELLTQVINAHPRNKHDVTCAPVPWRNLSPLDKKAAFGIMVWDEVVMPHPPVLRALKQTRQTLEAAGHEVIGFRPPIDCWDASRTIFDMYYPAGVGQMLNTLKASGEPLIPVLADLQNVYPPKELSAAELLQLNIKARLFREQFLAAWNKTAQETQNGHPIDALICPSAPTVGLPHDFNLYWGYTSLFNLIDYPSIILPIPDFQVNSEQDPVNNKYQPLDTNAYDESNYQLYDPELFSNQPSTIQIVGRPFEDEELVQVASVLDTLFRAA